VLQAASKAKQAGATRFCMGAACASHSKELADVVELVKGVRELGMETCVTLGMLRPGQAEQAERCGPGFITIQPGHSPISTADRHHARVPGPAGYAGTRAQGGIKVCCGGIIAWAKRLQRAALIAELAALDPPPERCGQHAGADRRHAAGGCRARIRSSSFARYRGGAHALPTVSFACPRTRDDARAGAGALLPGRGQLDLYGDRLLTTGNPSTDSDRALFERLGLHPTEPHT